MCSKAAPSKSPRLAVASIFPRIAQLGLPLSWERWLHLHHPGIQSPRALPTQGAKQIRDPEGTLLKSRCLFFFFVFSLSPPPPPLPHCSTLPMRRGLGHSPKQAGLPIICGPRRTSGLDIQPRSRISISKILPCSPHMLLIAAGHGCEKLSHYY